MTIFQRVKKDFFTTTCQRPKDARQETIQSGHYRVYEFNQYSLYGNWELFMRYAKRHEPPFEITLFTPDLFTYTKSGVIIHDVNTCSLNPGFDAGECHHR